MRVSPPRMWDGPSSFFELLLVPNGADYRMYDISSRRFPALKPGMLLFLRLLVNESICIPVAFEITRVDDRNLVIELAYLEQNVTHGDQTLTFVSSGSGTKVTQVSRFSSRSALRDFIYPFYHRQLVEDFHRHMVELLRDGRRRQ